MRTCLVVGGRRGSQAQHLAVLGVPHHGLVVADFAAVLPLPADAAEVSEAHHVPAEVRALLDTANRA